MQISALRYKQYEQSDKARFALEQEIRLLSYLISNWKRRKHSLLEIGCGTGYFLEYFWNAGFDVCGSDHSSSLLKKARSRLGNRVDFHICQAEHLPFNEKEFEYVVLLTILEFSHDPDLIVQEALRVCKKSLLIGFLNQWSLSYLNKEYIFKRDNNKNQKIKWWTWTKIRTLIAQNAGPCPMKTGSILIGPPWTWRYEPIFYKINKIIIPPYGGTFCAVRADMSKEKISTPLITWNTKPNVIGAKQ